MKKNLLLLSSTALLFGCASAGSVSTQDEVQIGAQEAQQVNAQLPMVNDAQINNYVNTLGNRIARLTSRGSELNWQFQVVNSSDVNAFAIPGGYIYVNRGVIERASNMSELAGVLGHEIQHVVKRHTVKQMAQAQNANTGVGILCGITSVCNSGVAQAGIQVAGTAVFAKFGRGDEIQADEGGFDNVLRAGIDPRGMYTFFQKLLAEQQSSGGGGTAGWFSDHPGTQDRLADIQKKITQAGKLTGLQRDESAFQTIKARVNRMGPAPRPQR
ncbi:MAG: M48 family metalloprotease [Gemmatimonadaceae bacterium]|nr:M48 family metalloprotease [Gemmatimonadaceae bacterium]